MKKILLLFCLSLVLTACKKNKTLRFSTLNFNDTSKNNCVENNCTYIHLEIPKISGDELIAANINNNVYKFVCETLSFDHLLKTNSFDSITKQFIANYDDIYKTYPTEAFAWEANFVLNQKKLSSTTYQFVYDFYVFTGSAQARKGKKVFLINIETGQQIKTEDLFLNFEGFKKLAEEEFTKQTHGKLDPNVRLFEGLGFQLPHNFYEENENWILHYNAYEIASNALTETIITLPKEKVNPLLNPLHFKN